MTNFHEQFEAKRKREQQRAQQEGAWFFGSICLVLVSIIVGALTYAFAGGIVGGLTACAAASFAYAALFGPRRPE